MFIVMVWESIFIIVEFWGKENLMGIIIVLRYKFIMRIKWDNYLKFLRRVWYMGI